MKEHRKSSIKLGFLASIPRLKQGRIVSGCFGWEGARARDRNREEPYLVVALPYPLSLVAARALSHT